MKRKRRTANEKRAFREMVYEWRMLMNYIYEHPKARKALAHSMQPYAPPVA